MKIYLAGAYFRKDFIRKAAHNLETLGVEIVSTWLQEEYASTIDIKTLPDDLNQTLASKDIDEIRNADAIVFFAEDQNQQPPRGGRHVEFGAALALGKRLIVVGERENIFHHLPQVEIIPSIEDLIILFCKEGMTGGM